jgi:hypothetical protein
MKFLIQNLFTCTREREREYSSVLNFKKFTVVLVVIFSPVFSFAFGNLSFLQSIRCAFDPVFFTPTPAYCSPETVKEVAESNNQVSVPSLKQTENKESSSSVEITKDKTVVIRGQDGAQGLIGPQGPQGERGERGPAGSSVSGDFVTQSFFSKQVDGILSSIEKGISGLYDQIKTSLSTGTLNVSGNTTIGGDLTVTGTMTGNISGNAGTATALQTSRTIAGVSFDGTADISIASTNLSDVATISRTGLLNVKNYGAVGDGATDDTSAINQAITAAVSSNKGVFFPAGSYKVASTIDLPSGPIVLQGEGKDVTKFIPASGVSTVFRFNSSAANYTHSTTLSANAIPGEYFVEVSSVSGLSVGQVVKIWDSEVNPLNANDQKVEFNEIASISGNRVYLIKAVSRNFLLSENASLGVGMDYTSVTMKDFSVLMPSPGGTAVFISNGYKVRISNILFDGAGSSSALVNIGKISDLVIDKNDFQHAYAEPPLVNGNYGFVIYNSTDVSISNNNISKVGEVFFGGVVRSQFINNKVTSSYCGFNFHGVGEVSAVVSGNIFSGNKSCGVEVWSNSKTSSNISITNNVFDSGGHRAIYVNGGPSFYTKNVVISGNTIRNYGNLADTGYRGAIIKLDYVRDVNISDNIISDSNSGNEGAIHLERDTRDVSINNNRIINHTNAAIKWGEVQRVVIKGNHIDTSGTGGGYVFVQSSVSSWASVSTATVARSGGVAEITTQSPHGFVVGDTVSITGITPTSPNYNMAFASVLSVPNSTTFTYRLYNDNGGTSAAGSNTTGTVQLTSIGQVEVTNNTFIRNQSRAVLSLISRLGKFQGNKFSASGMSDNSKQPFRYQATPSAGYPETFNDVFMWDSASMGFNNSISLINNVKLAPGEQFTAKRKNATIANLYTSSVKDQSTGGTLYTFPAGNSNGSVTFTYDVNPQTNVGSWITDTSTPTGSNILVGDGLGGFSTTSSSFINLNTTTGFIGIGTTNPLELLSLGLTGTTKGVLSFAGNTSGKIIIQPASDAGTFTLTLPTSDGEPNQVLSTDGSGVLSWVTVATGSVSQTPWASAINAAGFTLNGNSTASGNLTLDSTSDATKGNVLINPSGGSVGVGTSTPGSYKLNVSGSGFFNTTVTAGSGFSIQNSNGVFGSGAYNFYKPYTTTTVNGELSSSKSILFNIDADNSETGQSFVWGHNANGTSATALMTLLDSGNLGVGNSSPGTMLTVGTASTNTGNITVYGTGTTCVIGDGTGGTSCTSDLRLKDNITDMESELSHIMALRPVTFNWKDTTRDQVGNMGLIAQEVQSIYPNVVRTIYDDYLGIDYTTLVVPTIKAVQELNLKVESLAIAVDEENTKSFSDRFFENLFTKITTWLADAGNGIREMFAETFKAKDKICINETCVTELQLQMLLENANIAPVVPEPEPTPEMTPEPESTDTPEEPIPEPIPGVVTKVIPEATPESESTAEPVSEEISAQEPVVELSPEATEETTPVVEAPAE